ncbi:MAG: SDR family NAD(P)-dependent oxidoreductase [Kofleriaceae bacterium]|nr:SDR family NAD(P)-dependent oxidoreductase [Kofleriaceae bacterium]
MPTALVVGSSSGIGHALARRLVDTGYAVVGMARRDAGIAHERYRHVVADVRAPEFRAQLTDVLDSIGAPLELCVYSTGIGHPLDLADMTHDADTFATNLTGLGITAEVVIPRMIAAKRGHLIGLSSQADRWIDGDAPSYSASKAGMSSYLEGLALACRKHGVAVTNIRFGFVDTEMAKSDIRPFIVSAERAAKVVERCIRSRPIRHTFPRRIAVLLWLARIPRGIRILLS